MAIPGRARGLYERRTLALISICAHYSRSDLPLIPHHQRLLVGQDEQNRHRADRPVLARGYQSRRTNTWVSTWANKQEREQFMIDRTKSHYEVIVIGAGVAGIYQINILAHLG